MGLEASAARRVGRGAAPVVAGDGVEDVRAGGLEY